MSNRKHSATGNAGDGAHTQEQNNALYIAHQVHTLANLIFQRMTTGSGGFAAQGQHADYSHPGAAQFHGTQGASQCAWGNAGPAGGGSAQDATASVQGTAQNGPAFFPFGATQGGAMNNAYPFFGMQSFGFNPYGVGNATGSGFHPYFAGNNFGGAQSPFGFAPYGATPGTTGGGYEAFGNGFGFQPYSPFGFAPFGAMYGGNPYGFLPQWMFGNHAGTQGGFGPSWGMNAGNAAHEGACCNTGAGAPRNAFGPAPALFYWYP